MKPNFDDIIGRIISERFPVRCDNDGTHGVIIFDSRIPSFEGTKVKLTSASFDSERNHLSYGYDFVENPKNVPRGYPHLEDILVQIVALIYQVESQLLIQASKEK